MFQEPTTDRVQDSTGAKAMPTSGRSIFRAEAHKHYIQNQEKVVLPRLVSPQVFVYLWILALLVMAAGSIIAFWPLIRQMW
jgi:hypothetical protein